LELDPKEDAAREYQGYSIKQNSETGRWEIFWRERKQNVDFARVADAEEWIDDQIPSHRF
jgi:hypothetical protein